VTRWRGAPCGAPGAGRDPSMVGVQPSCQRSVPGIRVGFPRSAGPSSGGCRGSRRFTRFDPWCERRSAVLFRRGDRPTNLWRSWFPRGRAGFAATAITGTPRRAPDPPRERRAELADEEHLPPTKSAQRALPLTRCRASRRVCSPIGRSRSARCRGASTATTAPFPRTPDTARRLLQSTRNPSTPAR
jgi:hypothetical protein